MIEQEADTKRSPLVYSCYYTRSREGEQFVPEHVFSFQLSGTLSMNDGTTTHTFKEGEFRFLHRNQLLKFTKQPPEGGEFKSLSVYLDQETLRKFSVEYGFKSDKRYEGAPTLKIKPNSLLTSYMDSLKPYELLDQPGNKNLLELKQKEVLLILLKTNPELKDVLFDFTEPGKIDLEAFMNKNYHFNVELKRFAYLTGRSLATFKRDFEKIFHTSPSRWIQRKRLQEAHYLIKEKGVAPSDVYLELGFQDLSHFSFAFKKTYGVAPSRV